MTDTTTAIAVPAAMLRAALICASTEETRYYLRGIYVDSKGFLVTTDGHRAFVGRIDLADAAPFDGWTIPMDAAKRALIGYKPTMIEISPTRCGDIACTPVDGVYPDWRRSVPTELSGVVAQYNPAYLADMGKIGELLTGKRKNGGGLSAHVHHNGEAAAGITFPGCEDAFAVLMPIRSAHAGTPDSWATATTNL